MMYDATWSSYNFVYVFKSIFQYYVRLMIINYRDRRGLRGAFLFLVCRRGSLCYRFTEKVGKRVSVFNGTQARDGYTSAA